MSQILFLVIAIAAVQHALADTASSCGETQFKARLETTLVFPKGGRDLCLYNRSQTPLKSLTAPRSPNNSKHETDWKDHLLHVPDVWAIRGTEVCRFTVSPTLTDVNFDSCQATPHGDPTKLMYSETDGSVWVFSKGVNDGISPRLSGGTSYIQISSNDRNFSIKEVASFSPGFSNHYSDNCLARNHAMMSDDLGQILYIMNVWLKTEVGKVNVAKVGCHGYAFSIAGSKKRDSFFISCYKSQACKVIEVKVIQQDLILMQELNHCGDVSIKNLHNNEYLFIAKTSGSVPFCVLAYDLQELKISKVAEYETYSFIQGEVKLMQMSFGAIVVLNGIDPGEIVMGNFSKGKHNFATVCDLLPGDIIGVFSVNGGTIAVISTSGVSVVDVKSKTMECNISNSNMQRFQRVVAEPKSNYLYATPPGTVANDVMISGKPTPTPDFTRFVHHPSMTVDPSAFSWPTVNVCFRKGHPFNGCNYRREYGPPFNYSELIEERNHCDRKTKTRFSEFFGKVYTESLVDVLLAGSYRYEVKNEDTVMVAAGTKQADVQFAIAACTVQVMQMLPTVPDTSAEPPTTTSAEAAVGGSAVLVSSTLLLLELWQCVWGD